MKVFGTNNFRKYYVYVGGKINYLPTRNSTYLTSKINDKYNLTFLDNIIKSDAETMTIHVPKIDFGFLKLRDGKINYLPTRNSTYLTSKINDKYNLTFLDNIIKSDAETMTIHVPKIDFGFLKQKLQRYKNLIAYMDSSLRKIKFTQLRNVNFDQ
ncbi:hypothetical protein Glove_691g9 [Diversispora epigaea]|uniref:Uncharacterized protein n=1 Tax=Diversispora epigaea TaxID=1348612 RepID=A0A397G392_9GLOM|nr:hypothetical protein Glove_691g9 [Diversispora epigaea]